MAVDRIGDSKRGPKRMTASPKPAPAPSLGSALSIVVIFVALIVPIAVPILVLLFPFQTYAWAMPMTIGFFTSDLRWVSPSSLRSTLLRGRALPRALPLLVLALPLELILMCITLLELALMPFAHLAVVLYLKLRRSTRETSIVVEQRTAVAAEPPAPTPIAAAESMDRYVQHQAIYDALARGTDHGGARGFEPDVRLVRLSWLLQLASPGTKVHKQYGGVLNRRQDLPEEAFVGADELRQIEADAKLRWHLGGYVTEVSKALATANVFKVAYLMIRLLFQFKRNVDNLLPVVAVSYCWLEGGHPDREGKQLALLRSKLEGRAGERLGAGTGGLLRACKAYGFREMGVFVDWASVFQKDPALWSAKGMDAAAEEAYEASRNPTEKASFRNALESTMDLWYGHAATTVVLLTEFPRDIAAIKRTYESRGWTTFERCSAELAKSSTLTEATWKLVIDVGARHEATAARRLPSTPERMEQLLAQREFTNGADKAAVLLLYRQIATAVLGNARTLHFDEIALVESDEWRAPSCLAAALPYCVSLEQLHLCRCQLDDAALCALAAGLRAGALPRLKSLDLSGNRFSAAGVAHVGDALARGVAPSLETLEMAFVLMGDDGVKAVANALAAGACPNLHGLDLMGNDAGDQGAFALADALATNGCPCYPLYGFNRVSPFGRAAIVGALEGIHGGGPTKAPMNIFGGTGSVVMPPSLWRAWARGYRTLGEARRPPPVSDTELVATGTDATGPPGVSVKKLSKKGLSRADTAMPATLQSIRIQAEKSRV